MTKWTQESLLDSTISTTASSCEERDEEASSILGKSRSVDGEASSDADSTAVIACEEQEKADKKDGQHPTIERKGPNKYEQTLAQVTIISTSEINGVMWYTIQVQEGDTQIYCVKRYTDFVILDRKLRAHVNERTWGEVHARRVSFIPEMPEAGIFGFRHTFDVGDFNVKRQDGLQKYLDTIVAQIPFLASDPIVEEFLWKDAEQWMMDTVDKRHIQDAQHPVHQPKHSSTREWMSANVECTLLDMHACIN